MLPNDCENYTQSSRLVERDENYGLSHFKRGNFKNDEKDFNHR